MENKQKGHCLQDTPGTSLIKQKEKRFRNSEKQEISTKRYLPFCDISEKQWGFLSTRARNELGVKSLRKIKTLQKYV